jgi:hypothetical protein
MNTGQSNLNPTNGSWWIVQILFSRALRAGGKVIPLCSKDLIYPHTAVGGIGE